MIAHLKGELDSVGVDHVVVDVNGVGYKVFMPLTCLARMPEINSRIGMPIVTIVREDAISLYGFADNAQKLFFELLLTVSGVGPKAALNILSMLSVEDIKDAISKENHHVLSRVPGIGAKTAQRITVDLKDKVEAAALRAGKDIAVSELERAIQDAIEGLVGLGYNRQHAKKAVEQAAKSIEEDDAENLIKNALRLLSKT